MSELPAEPVHQGRRALTLCLGAAGIVYGDIGTSPIYAIRECFHVFHGVEPTPEAVLGVLSLIFWALVLVISAKYLFLVMRADNHGEGGIIALTALVSPPSRPARGAGRLLVLAGLFGAALLYGDSMITPAISVLSAVEGLRVATPVFEPFVLPITVLILVALFSVQSRGTARVGAVFGPIMVLWFLSLAALGAGEIIRHPQVLAALDPRYALRFFADHRGGAFLVLGAVFLVVTGGEALYADMGHFGRRSRVREPRRSATALRARLPGSARLRGRRGSTPGSRRWGWSRCRRTRCRRRRGTMSARACPGAPFPQVRRSRIHAASDIHAAAQVGCSGRSDTARAQLLAPIPATADASESGRRLVESCRLLSFLLYGLRTVPPFAIGMSNIPTRRYLMLNLIGAAVRTHGHRHGPFVCTSPGLTPLAI